MATKNGNGSSPGFYPKPKGTAVLKFLDGDYEGAVVECSLSASINTYLELTKGVATKEELRDLFQMFGDEILISWNVVDRSGGPRPPTGEGMNLVDLNFAQSVISAWAEAIAGVSAPLDAPSGEEDTSPVESIPMEVL